MDRYLISTNKGFVITNGDRIDQMPYTLDELLADHSILDTPSSWDHKIFFVTKNGKDYWENGAYV